MLPDKSFRLGTTSFIFPDHIIPNVRKLAPFFDEIELLVFESQPPDVLPSKNDVNVLSMLSQDFNLTYNIHLPVDISLTHDSKGKREKAEDRLLGIIDLFSSLEPTTHTLHFEMPFDIKSGIKSTVKPNHLHQHRLEKWTDTTRGSLASFVSKLSDPGTISIETLDFPFSHIETLVDEFKLSVCIDAGHQIKYGYNLLQTFETHKGKVPLIHLHGVDFSGQTIKDHTALDKLPETHQKQVRTLLENFTGVVSLEVFSLENLNRSLRVLSKTFKSIPSSVNAGR